MTKQITICVSGEGSNAKELCEYFAKQNRGVSIFKIMSTKHNPKLQRCAQRHDTHVQYVSKRQTFWRELIQASKTSDLIVLAGFLWIVPAKILESIKENDCLIMNIHPGPLPETAGLHGNGVHHKSLSLGITKIYHHFHWVAKQLDMGMIIESHSVKLKRNQKRTISSLSEKIKGSEHRNLGPCIESILTSKRSTT